MSDVLLERIAVALERIAANGPATVSGGASAGGGNVSTGSTVDTQQSTGNQTVTNDMLVALVQPLVQDENTKAKVKEVLTKYSLNRLGEAQESQYAALYAEFQAIKDAPAPSSGDLI